MLLSFTLRFLSLSKSSFESLFSAWLLVYDSLQQTLKPFSVCVCVDNPNGCIQDQQPNHILHNELKSLIWPLFNTHRHKEVIDPDSSHNYRSVLLPWIQPFSKFCPLYSDWLLETYSANSEALWSVFHPSPPPPRPLLHPTYQNPDTALIVSLT